MKIAIFSDSHLGKKMGRTPSSRKIYDEFVRGQFRKVLDEARTADLIVHAGDVFDTSKPNSDQKDFFNSELIKALDAGIEVMVIAGNHDRTLDHNLLEMYYPNLHIVNKMTTLELDGFNLVAFPYTENVSAIQQLLDSGKPDLFIAHQLLRNSWVGPQRMYFRGRKTLRPPKKGLLISGHVHRAQQVAERSVHCGSIVRTHPMESIESKGSFIINTEKDYISAEFKKLECFPLEVHEVENLNEFKPKNMQARLYLRLIDKQEEEIRSIYAKFPAEIFPYLKIAIGTRPLYSKYSSGFRDPSFEIQLK